MEQKEDRPRGPRASGHVSLSAPWSGNANVCNIYEPASGSRGFELDGSSIPASITLDDPGTASEARLAERPHVERNRGSDSAADRDTRTELARIQAQSEFVRERTRLHEAYVLEQCRNQRFGLVLAFLLIIAAVAALLFAPAGRENLSYWIGAALLVFAAGASGFGRIWAKAPGFSMGASTSSSDAAPDGSP